MQREAHNERINVEQVPPLDGLREHTDGDMHRVACAAIVGLAVFATCLFGIHTRPVGFLASIWLANAVLLGLLIRLPNAATPLGWAAATIGYLAADMLTGATLLKAGLLTAGNIAGVAAGLLFYARLPWDIRTMRHPAAPLFLIVASMLGGAAAGMVGAIANPMLFGASALSGWSFWFATETANYLAILPVLLTIPSWAAWARALSRPWRSLRHVNPAPALALLLSCLAGSWIGGPGAIAFPVPALLWCGLTYSVFATALSTFIFCMWALLAAAAGYLPFAEGASDEYALISLRVGVSLIALAPLMVASVTAMRDELLRRMQHQAANDYLTGIPNRRAFRDAAAAIINARGTRSIALLMIDIDFFKDINDRHGHGTGDEVLQLFAARLQSNLMPTEMAARLGGEEFVVIVPNCWRDEARAAGERIRLLFAGQPIRLHDGQTLPVTTSIGVSFADGEHADLDAMLRAADKALYKAKALGRDRVAFQEVVPMAANSIYDSAPGQRPTDPAASAPSKP